MLNAIVLSVIMLIVVMISVIMLNAIILSVIMLDVLAPLQKMKRNLTKEVSITGNNGQTFGIRIIRKDLFPE
jgi:hypothetical protein